MYTPLAREQKAINTICTWRNTVLAAKDRTPVPSMEEALRYLISVKACSDSPLETLKQDERLLHGRKKDGTPLGLNVPNQNKGEGWRNIGNQQIWFENPWHANYARFLDRFKEDFSIIKWEYKPKKFRITVHGVYEPTFRVTYKNGNILWVELDCHDTDSDLKSFFCEDLTHFKCVKSCVFECYFPHEKIIRAEIANFKGKQEFFKHAIPEWE